MTGKNPLPRKLSIPFFILFFLFPAINVMAGGRGQETLRTATGYTQRCEIPYNINIQGYTTGLHIVVDSIERETVTLEFYNGSYPYATRDIEVPPEGLTGTAESFLPSGYSLRFPTLIYAYWRPDDSYEKDLHFWVTQFLFTDTGFSHQTFVSHDYTE